MFLRTLLKNINLSIFAWANNRLDLIFTFANTCCKKSAHHIDNKDISISSLFCCWILKEFIKACLIIIYTTRHHSSQTALYYQSFNPFCAKWTQLYGFSFWNSAIYWWAIIIIWVFILLFVLYLTHLCQRVNIKYHIKTHKMFYCTKGNLK